MAKGKSNGNKTSLIVLGLAFVLTSIVFGLYFAKNPNFLNNTQQSKTATYDSAHGEIEEAIRQNVNESYSGINHVLTSIEVEGDWAIVSGYLEETSSGDIVTPGGVTFIAKFENGSWEAEGFNSERGKIWACEAPATLISNDLSKYLLGNDFSCP